MLCSDCMLLLRAAVVGKERSKDRRTRNKGPLARSQLRGKEIVRRADLEKISIDGMGCAGGLCDDACSGADGICICAIVS